MLSERENNNESYRLGICGLIGKDKTVIVTDILTIPTDR